MSRNRTLLSIPLVVAALAGCSDGAADVTPPVATRGSGSAVVAPAGGNAVQDATAAVRDYLRQQALAVNAGTAEPARIPGFTATLTAAAQEWAVPLLAANLGDRMPGPYPVGVLDGSATTADRVELDLCLQDRGWQVDRTTGQPVNDAHYATAHAVVVRAGERWLVDDLVSDGRECSAGDVQVERF